MEITMEIHHLDPIESSMFPGFLAVDLVRECPMAMFDA